MNIQTVKTTADIDFCRDVLTGLRPHLDTETLVPQIAEIMNENYQICYIADDSDRKAACFIGYRSLHMLRTGKIIYIDDLFTLPEYRGRGYARTLLNHVHKLAAETGVKSVHLDSGYAKHDAHRLYLNKGYILECFHFANNLQH
ncbi:GNAT family N-acetyltransferase [Mucilaginibacter sp. SP1R1]|uniref:GNAT family N-acetyltransferase n=1 Tax=Mucilaginibacter sp. SP1R1 TaxID=2723091 RepID=UPI0016207775|nr:GNAT family N-acetyltransferase [Mucilaginibacter sp. SP1R1]MBB6147639.1 GNAT superfamily N-acetyltransferase [Mucilaginibacter sp. SP1R1]